MKFSKEDEQVIARERERHLNRTCYKCGKPRGEKEMYLDNMKDDSRLNRLVYYHTDCNKENK